jgi:hypothetical protein
MTKAIAPTPQWAHIIKHSKQWFSKNTMDFWQTEVLWDTLNPIGDGEYLFITIDDNFNRDQRLYSVRWVTAEGRIATVTFQTSDNLEDATKELHEASFTMAHCG